MANKDNEIPVKLTVDTSALDDLSAAASDVPDSIDITANVTVDDSELSAIDDIPETTETEMDIVETEDAKQAIADIHFMALKEKIETVWNIAGTAIGFITDVGGKLLTPFLDVEDAVARINAQTGGTGIADLGQFIRDIQAADLGESTEQIADVVIKAQQLGLPIKEATESALLFTHTWSDQDPATIVGAWGTALQTGIVDNMQEASDLMTVFFQQGGNIGGDAVQVVQANAQSWADMGLNMAEALSLMDSLQQGTGASATDAAKMMQTFDDALTTAAADPASQQARLLRLIGVDNPKKQGETIGAETFDGFAEAFAAASSEDQDLMSGLFFGKGGKKFTGAISEMTSEGNPFKDVTDAAAEAAAEIDNSLRGVIDDFVLAINTSISELLSSDAIDLPGKIEALKKGLQQGLEVLGSGGSLGEALEVTFGIEGVDTALTNIQRVFGQFVLAILEVVAALQDPLGLTDADKGTRAEIARLAGQQLPFDLKVANPDEIAGIVDQAAARGVTNLGGSFNTAMNELISEGNFGQAQGLLDAIVTNSDVSPEAAKTLADKWGKLIEDAQSQITFATGSAAMPSDVQQRLGLGSGGESGGMFASALTAFEEVVTKSDEATANVATNWSNLPLTLDPSTQAIVTQMDTVGTTAQTMDTTVATALTGNTVTQSFLDVQMAADTSFPIVLQWFGQMASEAAEMDVKVSGSVQHMLNLLHDLQFLSAQVSTGVQAALTLGANLPGAGGGGGGGMSSDTTITVNQTNNNQNGPQLQATTYEIAAAINGGR